MDKIDQMMSEQSGVSVWEDGKKVSDGNDTKESDAPTENLETKDEEQQKTTDKESQEKKTEDNRQETKETNKEGEGQKQEKIDWLSRFNERFKTSYESEDQVKELFDYKSQYDNIKQTLEQKEKALGQASDPSSYFANDDVMKLNKVVEDNNLDVVTASRIINTDFSKMDAEDVLVMSKILDEPTWQGSEDLVREEIQEQYGLDRNPDDIEDENEKSKVQRKIERGKKRLAADAEKAKKKFTEMQQVQLPGKKDLEAQYQEKKEGFKKPAEKLVGELDKVNYHEDMEFTIDDEWKSKFLTPDKIAEEAAMYNLDLTKDEVYNNVKDYLKRKYIADNFDKILSDFKKKMRTDQKDEEFDKYNNPRDNNRQTKPDNEPAPKSREKVNEKIARDFGIK